MSMTVDQLRELLDEVSENGLGSCELRLAIQPNYPLSELLRGIWYDEEKEDDAKTVFIVNNGQDRDDPYAPKEAFENPMIC